MLTQAYRILAVDDLPDNLALLQTILELAGYTVEVATCGFTALEKIHASPPDLVLLDVMMPGLNGYEVVQKLRQNDQFTSLPVLLVTAHDDERIATDAIQGINGLIPKPIDVDELLNQVQTWLPSDQSTPSQGMVCFKQTNGDVNCLIL